MTYLRGDSDSRCTERYVSAESVTLTKIMPKIVETFTRHRIFVAFHLGDRGLEYFWRVKNITDNILVESGTIIPTTNPPYPSPCGEDDVELTPTITRVWCFCRSIAGGRFVLELMYEITEDWQGKTIELYINNSGGGNLSKMAIDSCNSTLYT